MQYEYAAYINDSPIGLQYHTVHLYNTKYLNIKCIKHVTPNDKQHDIYDSAVIFYHSNGAISSIDYCINNKIHREYSPAVITYHRNGIISSVEHWFNGKCHNEHGPAVTRYNPDGTISHIEYWINNEKVDTYDRGPTYKLTHTALISRIMRHLTTNM